MSISLLTDVEIQAVAHLKQKYTENSALQKNRLQAAQKESELMRIRMADQLLCDLKGTYQELWPVILADEHDHCGR